MSSRRIWQQKIRVFIYKYEVLWVVESFVHPFYQLKPSFLTTFRLWYVHCNKTCNNNVHLYLMRNKELKQYVSTPLLFSVNTFLLYYINHVIFRLSDNTYSNNAFQFRHKVETLAITMQFSSTGKSWYTITVSSLFLIRLKGTGPIVWKSRKPRYNKGTLQYTVLRIHGRKRDNESV